MDDGESDDGSCVRGEKRPAPAGDGHPPPRKGGKDLAGRAARKADPERRPAPREPPPSPDGLDKAINRLVAGSPAVRQRIAYVNDLNFRGTLSSDTEDDETPAPRQGPPAPRRTPAQKRAKTVSYLLRQEGALETARAENAAANREVMEHARARSYLCATGRALRGALVIARKASAHAEKLRLSTEENLAAFTSFEEDAPPPRVRDPAPVAPEEREAAMGALLDKGTDPSLDLEKNLVLEEAVRDSTALRLEEELQWASEHESEHEDMREEIARCVEDKIRLDELTAAATATLEREISAGRA
jgi:hypothetical protein